MNPRANRPPPPDESQAQRALDDLAVAFWRAVVADLRAELELETEARMSGAIARKKAKDNTNMTGKVHRVRTGGAPIPQAEQAHSGARRA